MQKTYEFPDRTIIVAARVRSSGSLLTFMQFQYTGQEQRIVEEWTKDTIGNHGFVGLEFGYYGVASDALMMTRKAIMGQMAPEQGTISHTLFRHTSRDTITDGVY